MKFTSQAIVCFLATLYKCGVYGKQQDDQQRNLRQRHPPNERRSLTAARIVGGNPSKPGEYPYYVLMGVGDDGGCGGSLIAPRVVLTAAHCKPEQYNKGKQVTVGPSNRYSLNNGSFQKAEKILVTDAKSHPNFVFDTNDNDYALVLLEKPYDMDSDIQLVLNENTNFPQDNEMLDALGMGDTKENGPVTVELRDVKVPAMTNKECRKYYGSDVKNNMLCAGYKEGKKNICYGDSGGPLVKVDGNKHIQVGISSFVGEKCAGKNSPGGYARVSEEINWMRGVICNTWKVESSLCGPSLPTPPPAPSPTRPPAPAPTRPPAPSPTRPPAPSPTRPPVPSPTRPPAQAPTDTDDFSPTFTPTFVPTSDCSDASGSFKVGNKMRKCNWARKKRNQRCDMKVKKSGGKRVWEFCPDTCDEC